MTVRTRFAPSPTGSLHVGGVRTALYCLLYARKTGGRFVLRIEDTDQARSTEEAAAGIQRDLRWCGLDWDEGPGKEQPGDAGPYFQSRRLDLYNTHVDRLLASGHAFLAWESRDELDAMRKQAEKNKETFRYKRVPYTDAQLARFRAEGRVPVVRLEAPKHDVTVADRILGEVTLEADELEDIVIRKADGFPTYHFAVVIDDHHMGVTDILRGQEHLMNTHKHLGIYEALAWDPPTHGHLPLIFNPQGAKMSKREKAQTAREAARKAQDARKARGHDPADWSWLATEASLATAEVASFMKRENDRIPVAEAIAKALGVELPLIEVMDYRKGGYLPEALVNYLALLGWSPGDDREIMGFDEMVEAFSLERIKHTAARFDPDKLKWMNGEYIKRSSVDRLLAVLELYLEVVDSPLRRATIEQRKGLLAMYKDRVATLADLDRVAAFFFRRPEAYDDKAVGKHLDAAGIARLRDARTALASVPRWDAKIIEDALQLLADGRGDTLGKYAQPLRIAVTGTAVSPAIHDTLAWWSQDEVLGRIDACLERLERPGAA